MPTYPGRRQGTRRVVIWAQGQSHEWIVEGTKAESESFLAKKRLELDVAKKAERRVAPTFSVFCESHYRPHAEAHLRDSTWRKVRIYQVATLEEHFGPIKLSALTIDDVEAYKRWRLRDVRPSSCNNELRVFGTILAWAKELRFPVATLKIRKVPEDGSPRVRFWTAAEIARVFVAARSDGVDLLPMLIFMLNTGVRKGEALAAEWDWIDDAAGMIRIPVNDFWRPKNGKPREVPLADAVRAVLAGQKLHERWIFPSVLGARYVDFPKEGFNRIIARADVKGGPHTTRHTFASHFLQRVPDLFLLAKVLGHSHGRVTELYAHLLPDHLAKARNAVNVGPSPMRLIKVGA